MRILLASASPQRLTLLRELGLDPGVAAAALDESLLPGEAAVAAVRRLALAKARAAARSQPSGALVLGADTVVEVEGETLGKPRDDEDARRMLLRLSGRSHQVHTGVALIDAGAGREASGVSSSEVVLATLRPDEVAWYVATGEPRGKAGAYAIQGKAALFIRTIRGSHSGVVGLPLDLFYLLSLELGHDLKASGGPP